MKSKLIVIEGIDGSGKSTQTGLLYNYFLDKGYNTKIISFPKYEDKSSCLVKMYLNGIISDDLNEINAYAASSFYACDRYISYKKDWEKDYKQGTIFIFNRYVISNAIHQMVKLPKDQWDCYLKWLDDYEYCKLGLPKPDKVIFLDVSPKISEKLITKRYNENNNENDLHERNKDYMIKCYKSYSYICAKYNFDIVKCFDNNGILTEKDIFNKIVLRVKEVL